MISVISYFAEPFLLLLCHLIGDYVLQCDFIAKTKGENWYHLFVHCVLYIAPFWYFYGFDYRLDILFISHFIIDMLKARFHLIDYLEDQVMHYFVILILYTIL